MRRAGVYHSGPLLSYHENIDSFFRLCLELRPFFLPWMGGAHTAQRSRRRHHLHPAAQNEMSTPRRAPSRRNARTAGTAQAPGVIIQLVSFTIGGGQTIATFRALTAHPAIIATTDPDVIGYWFLTGYFGGAFLALQATALTAGVADSSGVLFGIVFSDELSDNAPWTMSAPRVQTAVRGALGGQIAGMLFTEQEMGGFTSGAVPIIGNEGNPVLPPLLVFVAVVIYSADTLEVQFQTASASAPDFDVFGYPAWLIGGSNSVLDTTSPGPGILRVQFADPISSGQILTVPAWDPWVRSTAGEWIPPLQVST